MYVDDEPFDLSAVRQLSGGPLPAVPCVVRRRAGGNSHERRLARPLVTAPSVRWGRGEGLERLPVGAAAIGG